MYQNGGEDTDFFNALLDNILQQNSVEEETPQDINVDEEDDYIKGLREYADEFEEKQSIEEDYSSKIDSLKSIYDSKIEYLQNQLTYSMFFASPEGQEYTEKMFNTRDLSLEAIKQKQEYVESRGNINAVSPKGAQGAFQFMPSTWEQYKPSPNASPFNRSDASVAYDKYMNVLLKKFNGDKRKAVASYNAGEGRVQKLVNKYGDNWANYLPSETKNYLKQIFGS